MASQKLFTAFLTVLLACISFALAIRPLLNPEPELTGSDERSSLLVRDYLYLIALLRVSTLRPGKIVQNFD